MKKIVPQYLFVYSSLRLGLQQPEFKYITQFFESSGKGKVRGILSKSAAGPVATPVEDDRYIIGELLHLKSPLDFSWAFGQLDSYEGISPEEGEKSQFRREITHVFTDDGQEIDSWIYWYNGNVEAMEVIESGDVMAM